MKKYIKNSFAAGIVTLSLFLSVGYVSCTKSNDNKCSVTCVNGGICKGSTCSCPTGYEGTTCQNNWSLKFANEWNVTETTSGSSTPNTYTDVIVPSSTVPTVFTVNGFDGVYNGVAATVTSSREFTFVPATYTYVYTYTGSGLQIQLNESLQIISGSGSIDSLGINITGSYICTHTIIEVDDTTHLNPITATDTVTFKMTPQ